MSEERIKLEKSTALPVEEWEKRPAEEHPSEDGEAAAGTEPADRTEETPAGQGPAEASGEPAETSGGPADSPQEAAPPPAEVKPEPAETVVPASAGAEIPANTPAEKKRTNRDRKRPGTERDRKRTGDRRSGEERRSGQERRAADRTGGGASPRDTKRKRKERSTGKPVTIYILLLFTMALLLIALSSLMHQRSNSEALGKIQRSVSAIQEVQNFQERIISLQEARQDAEDQLRTVQSDLLTQVAQTTTEHNRGEALLYLYRIQMEYQAGRYQRCQAIIAEFEAQRLVAELPEELEDEDIVSPLQRFRQLKEANQERLAEAGQYQG